QVLKSYDDIFWGLDSRSMLVMTMFELGQWIDLQEHELKNFVKFMQRNPNISSKRRKSYLAFVHALRLFLRILLAPIHLRQKNLLALKQKLLLADRPISPWIMQKIDAYLKP
ncbi:MAG: hypothetical protein AAF570_18240, partial [Bacteroidota bacterium]